MDRSVAIMPDMAQSLLDKLKNKSRNTGKDFQLVLQLFCQEEFLRRLQLSQYSNNLILKGGLFLYSISGFESRPTRDVDFLLKNISNAQEMISSILKEIIAIETPCNFVIYEVKSLEPIAEHREYNGIRAKVIARIKNTRTPFDIDMGVGDIIVPKPELRSLPTQLEGFDEPRILVYSLESTIAEKFDAIISRLELSSRMKDYYDIYYLAHTYSFDGRKLQEAIFETLQHRGTPYEADTMTYIQAFSEDKDMLFKWNQYKKDTLKIDVEFNEIMGTIFGFIDPVFQAIVNENEFFGQWNPEALAYFPL
jgi:predicted nucleotidyltransferase component of viral defense system